MKVILKCDWCGNSVVKQWAWAKRTSRHYCNRACYDCHHSALLRTDEGLGMNMALVRSHKRVPRYLYGKQKGYRRHKSGMLEHRFVMEQIIGRPLLPTEVVHHKNRNPLDNRPENLEIMHWSDHSSHHFSEYYANPNNREASSRTARSWWETATPEQREARKASMRVPKRRLQRNDEI